ncbi:hypothetical protein [Thermomonas carbonis]|uniref:Polymer-forming cytoskeletal protein n=1 Tax=Thermomonas carbonis TaxID=1463158 RepID=A0A7G9SSD3_9GAMM|nr:hypothetical protein [Thermomonas carbonis]QNN70758.1 hypothetical protein H9L16_03900 [Thermomonas carbonis]GHC02136.1 hypothetical protein GCM10010080_14900 [Thermomonas carbonis]
MKRSLLFVALLAFSSVASAAGHDGPGRDIDKVNGSITASAGEAYGDLSTVNGGIDLERGARVGDVETVNGGVEAADDVGARSVSTVNGAIRFGKQARIDGDVETVNGGIFIDRGGNVRDDISTVNGAIGLVDTDLGGGIETVNGDITVGVGSHVKGGIHVEKPSGNGMQWGKQRIPRIVIGPNAVVDGPLVFERDVVLYVHGTARIGSVRGATPTPYNSATPPKD